MRLDSISIVAFVRLLVTSENLLYMPFAAELDKLRWNIELVPTLDRPFLVVLKTVPPLNHQ